MSFHSTFMHLPPNFTPATTAAAPYWDFEAETAQESDLWLQEEELKLTEQTENRRNKFARATRVCAMSLLV